MEGGEWPHWNAKGDRIYYVQGLDVMEVEVTYEPTVQLSRPKKLFALQDHLFGGWSGTPFFAVTGDGERFVVTRVDETVSPDARGIVVVQNWVSEFESR